MEVYSVTPTEQLVYGRSGAAHGAWGGYLHVCVFARALNSTCGLCTHTKATGSSRLLLMRSAASISAKQYTVAVEGPGLKSVSPGCRVTNYHEENWLTPAQEVY